MDVVLIHLGSRPPRYLRACTRQVEKVAGAPPVLVGPLRGARYRGEKLRRFRATEGLTELGLGGFWRYAAERFFVLEEHMRKTGLERCLHIESDCLLYVAPSAYEGWLSDVYGDSVATCPLTDDQDTAAAMYVGSLQALSAFNLALLRLVALGPARLLELHGGEMGNEMRMIRVLRDAGLARALPVTVAQAKALGSPIIFDPASYGQFVDGTPGAPGVPYAGEHHQAGRELIGGHCQILWNTQRRCRSSSRAARAASTRWQTCTSTPSGSSAGSQSPSPSQRRRLPPGSEILPELWSARDSAVLAAA